MIRNPAIPSQRIMTTIRILAVTLSLGLLAGCKPGPSSNPGPTETSTDTPTTSTVPRVPSVPTVADLAYPRDLPDGTPKASDVLLSSRLIRPLPPSHGLHHLAVGHPEPIDTFDAVRDFHPTMMAWLYIEEREEAPGVLPVREAVKRLADMGLKIQGAMNTDLPDSRPEIQRSGKKALDGSVIPWRWNRVHLCPNAPDTMPVKLDWAMGQIDAGATLLHADDWEFAAFAREMLPHEDFYRSEKCYCDYCAEGFREFLARQPADVLAGAGIEDPSSFDMRAYLKENNLPPDQVDTPAERLYDDYALESLNRFWSTFQEKLDERAGRHIPMSANNYGGKWEPIRGPFAFGMAEMPHKLASPEHVYTILRELIASGRDQVFTYYPRDTAETRRYFATTVASGGNMIIPWDVYMGVDEPRYFGSAEEYADLTGFLRANPDILDGYEDGAVNWRKLEDPRYPENPPIAFPGDEEIFGLVRVHPDKSRPVAIHLVDWSDSPDAFDLLVDPSRFPGDGALEFELRTPAPFDAALHDEVRRTGNFERLSESRPLEVVAVDGLLRVRVPALQPWGVLLVRPGGTGVTGSTGGTDSTAAPFHSFVQPSGIGLPKETSAGPARNDVSIRTLKFQGIPQGATMDVFEAIRRFHANRLDWVYWGPGNRSEIEKVKAMGIRLGSAVNGETSQVIPPPGTQSTGAFRAALTNRLLDGSPLYLPWKTWAKKNNVFEADTTNPEYYDGHLRHLKSLVDLGAGAIQRDEAGSDVLAAARYGGGFTDAAMGAFREWLAARQSPEELKALGIDNLEGFDFRNYLRAAGAPSGWRFRDFKDPLKDLWLAFWEEHSAEFWSRMIRDIKAYARSQGQEVEISCNNGSLQLWGQPYQQFDFGMSEMMAGTASPGIMFNRARAARSVGRHQMFNCPKIAAEAGATEEERVALTRRVIAMAHSLGMTCQVPWDKWNAGAERYFGRPADYADLYAFVRANDWDGYVEAGMIGPEAPEQSPDPGHLLHIEGGNGHAYAMVNVHPEDPRRPPLIFLVDWGRPLVGRPPLKELVPLEEGPHGDNLYYSKLGLENLRRSAPEPFTLVFSKSAFHLDPEKLRFELLEPVPPDPRADPASQTASGPLQNPVRRTVLPVAVDQDHLRVALPRLNPWGVLKISPTGS